jgi:uncharacterized linocin/CFP29 family protein
MNHLLRSHAPITDAAWTQLDGEVKQRIMPALAARRLTDFVGPLGWEHSSTNLGRISAIDAPGTGMVAYQRRVLPLSELRADFTVARSELRDFDRGAPDLDLDDLDGAVRRLAEAENLAVFHGWAAAGIVGIAEAGTNPQIPLGTDVSRYTRHVAKAMETLLIGGIEGPYALALGPDAYTAVVEATEHGGPTLFDHLRAILGGPIVWSPGLKGALVVSLRGGDFLLEVGQDLAVGYDHHDADNVHLYIEESFNFRIVTPEAAVVCTP